MVQVSTKSVSLYLFFSLSHSLPFFPLSLSLSPHLCWLSSQFHSRLSPQSHFSCYRTFPAPSYCIARFWTQCWYKINTSFDTKPNQTVRVENSFCCLFKQETHILSLQKKNTNIFRIVCRMVCLLGCVSFKPKTSTVCSKNICACGIGWYSLDASPFAFHRSEFPSLWQKGIFVHKFYVGAIFPCLQNTAEIIHFGSLYALLKSNSRQKVKYNNDSLQKRIRLNAVVLFQVFQKSVRNKACVIPGAKKCSNKFGWLRLAMTIQRNYSKNRAEPKKTREKRRRLKLFEINI